jgi:hypothetical protein
VVDLSQCTPECTAAIDFVAVEVCTLPGLMTHYVLFFVSLAIRAAKIGGGTTNPDDPWMM